MIRCIGLFRCLLHMVLLIFRNNRLIRPPLAVDKVNIIDPCIYSTEVVGLSRRFYINAFFKKKKLKDQVRFGQVKAYVRLAHIYKRSCNSTV